MRIFNKTLTGIAVTMVLVSSLAAQEKQLQYLSGTGSDHTVAWDFFCTAGRQSGYWTEIAVPSCWELQGFGNYNYGRDYKTNGKNFRFYDEKGMYKHRFTVPASWKGKQVSIVFEGSMTDTEVKVNGKSAGAVHQGAFYRFTYDITDKIVVGGANQLEVTVSKMSDNASVNNAERLADYWVFGGIFRPVYLEAVPKQHIEYLAVDAKADGRFAVRSRLSGIGESSLLVAEILDQKGKKIASVSKPVHKADTSVLLETNIVNPLTWTSETPNLYQLHVSLRKEGKTLYTTKEKFGFRTIEIRRGDGIYLNGVQIKMKGTNRHCFWPETGRTLNDAIQLQDVLLLKEMNMNAVRCSHYPPDKRFLELCDSLGLYVLDELAGWQKYYATEVGRKLVKEMVTRDMNHPSIIFWDNGNEGGTNKELDREFGKWDLSGRPVIHPHHRPGNEFSGIDCNHYEDYYSTKKILNDSLIYMPTEFLHSQDDGGGAAGMSDFWELHWKSKRSGGGFTWAMLDEAVVRTDLNNVLDANGLNANDGILGPHREKEGSYFAMKEIFSPVKISWKELPAGFDGKIPVENRYHFTNLDQCHFQWALVNYVSPQDRLNGYHLEKKGMAATGAVMPGASGIISLGLPGNYRDYDALVLVASDPAGREIYKWIWKLKSNAELLAGIIPASDSVTAVSETDTSYVLKGGELTITLDRRTGMLVNAKNSASDNLSFAKGPLLVQGSTILTAASVSREGSNSVAVFRYERNMRYAKWTIYGSGWVSLEYEYALNDDYPFAGISFQYPENFMLGAKWLGKGPYRQWKNRSDGTPVNVWQNLYNNTQTGYSPVVYPEFKGYYGDITWMEFSTVEGKFYVASKDTGLYVRLFDFYGLTGLRPHPELPKGNISFLDCIPPIGSKLALNINYNTASLGPASELTRINSPVKRTLYFYFGTPKTTSAREKYSRPAIDNVF
ncbi:glycoside hydrolase family 2 protein [Sediminibacterium soli]|uniref:glycoside hydrolase family 2 protein n=1 Tax=Sediminibacterium soli TaxID=2698829 RepID=UPI001379D1FE|nr:glycoside hydrolase family 2 TIM barrel-domain containing protein [Sediminibacterium soli]NCI46853.1 glycoside hydrolase family 2 [Sediminibacterium soli]